MENLLVTVLPKDKHPVLVRYGVTLVIIGIAFLLRLALDAQMQGYPLLLFVPVVVLAALLFDKGTGFFATAVTTGLAAYFLVSPRYSFAVDVQHFVPLALYAATGVGLSLVVEALRQAVRRLAKSEEQKTLLLEELAHRTKNDLMMISSVLTLQARGQTEPAARAALESAITRVQVISKAQERLHGDRNGGAVEVGGYLEALCSDLGDLLRDVRPIAVRVRTDRLQLSSSQAVSVGLIANELVTNAFKYAFPGDRGGVVEVDLRRQEDALVLTVADDGVGCPAEPVQGMGSRLVRLLAGQLNGQITRDQPGEGCRVTVTLPMEGDGLRAR